jgi:hypothetical protein
MMRSTSVLRHLPKQSRTLAAFAMALSPLAKASDAAPIHAFKLKAKLVDDFILWSGGTPSDWPNQVPPTLFPYWTMPALVTCIRGRDIKLAKLLNGGCTIQQFMPIPTDSTLCLETWFKGIEHHSRYDLISIGSRTKGTDEQIFLETEVRFILPKRAAKRTREPSKDIERPKNADRIATLEARLNDGFTFACLTGDFNPIHWVPTIARLSGFAGCIQHGFGTLAKSYEHLLNNGKLTRDTCVLKVDFKRTVPLPSTASLFADNEHLSVWVDGMQHPSLQGQFKS